ncbi:MAG TPA: porin [Rhodothermales bacterium]
MMLRLKFAILTAATALAVAPARAQDASAEAYGDFRYSLNYADAGDTTHWASANNASRFGVRGEVKGEKLAAFVDLQSGVSIDGEAGGVAFTQRIYVAGLRGAFGQVSFGRQNMAYKLAGLRLDPFYDTSTLSTTAGVPVTGLFAGASFGLSELTNGFANRSLAYTSPDLHGVTLNAVGLLDPDGEHDFGVGGAFRREGLEVGVQYFDVRGGAAWAQTAGIDYAVRVHGQYTAPAKWSVGASYEHIGDDVDGNLLYVSGTVTPVPPVTVAASVGFLGGDTPFDGYTGVHAGVFYTLLPGVRVHALFSYVDVTDSEARANGAVGFSYQFVLKP